MTMVNSGLKGLNPHDSSKHYIGSLKSDFISSTQQFQNENFLGNVLFLTISFFHLIPTSSHLHPLQVEKCDSNSRLVADQDE